MLKKSSLFVLAFLPLFATAESNDNWLPLNARANFSAEVTGIGIFGADLMQPIYGKQDAFFHGDFMGDYGTDDTFLISPGGGYRTIVSNQILGAYFFGDYEKVSDGQNFWVLSPGIEWMNVRWDAHVNGYFPTETSKQSGAENFASNLGDSSGVSFVEGTHNQYDNIVAPYDVIGNGVDAEIGYSFATLNNLRSRVYLGGYYYGPPSSYNVDNITGVTAGYEQPITKNLMVSIFNSYDQVSNYTAGVGLTLSFGEESTVFSNNIQDRMLDPIERHVGVIATGAGTYDQQSLDTIGRGLQYDNVYFMEPASVQLTSGSDTPDGTYGNPMQLNQTSLDTIDAESSSSRIYLQGGSDAVYIVDESTATETDVLYDSVFGLYAHGGQSFYGRTSDYTAPASSSEQPIIDVDSVDNYSAFVLTESGENTFSDLTITSSTEVGQSGGILAYNITDGDMLLNIYNTTISADSFLLGVGANNLSTGDLTVNMDNVSIDNNANLDGDDYAYFAAGVYATNNSTGTLTLNAKDSSFSGNGTAGGDSSIGVSAGIIAEANNGTVNVNITDSSLDNNGKTNENGQQMSAAAGLITGGANDATVNVNIKHSTFSGNGTFAGSSTSMDSVDVAGLLVASSNSADINMNISDSQFNNNGDITGSAEIDNTDIAGITLGNTGTGTTNVSISNSQFNGNGVITGTGSMIDSTAVGMYIYETQGTTNVTVTNSMFNNNGQYGILAIADTAATLNINTMGSTFSGNGTAATYALGSGSINWVS